MSDGAVRVRSGGEEAIVETPSLDGEIGVDLDAGSTGTANVHVPIGTHTFHDEEFDSDGDESARADGGAVAPPQRVTVRGSGLNEGHAMIAMIAGLLCILGGATSSGSAVPGVLGGFGLALIGAKSYFTYRATGGDR